MAHGKLQCLIVLHITGHIKFHRIRMSAAQAEVSCSIVGSSIALLTGQKPPFRLLARAVRGSTGERLPHIKPAVSDAFVVATQRVKTAQKVCLCAHAPADPHQSCANCNAGLALAEWHHCCTCNGVET